MSDFQLDTREFSKAFDQIVKTHKKDVPKYLNKKALSVLIGSGGHPGAVQLTPEADKSKMAAVTDKQLAGRIIKRAKAKGKWPMTAVEIKAAIIKERKRMVASSAYTRGPGWLKAAVAMGGTGRKGGKKNQPQPGFSKSKAAKGFGKKATAGKLAALLVNAAPAAAQIGREALQRAVDGQTADMRAFGARDLLSKTFRKHSAR